MTFRTYPCGIKFNPWTPTPDMININDIAHALSLIRRWGGFTRIGYSVGQHSLLVSGYCPQEYKFRGLLHDATEAYLGDMIKPLKAGMSVYQELENALAKMIYEKFGLSPIMSSEEEEIIKHWDNQALYAEGRDLTMSETWKTKDIEITRQIIPANDISIECEFLHKFHTLRIK